MFLLFRHFGHLLRYCEPAIRRAVPLALGLISVSNPQLNILDTLTKFSHDTGNGKLHLTIIFKIVLLINCYMCKEPRGPQRNFVKLRQKAWKFKKVAGRSCNLHIKIGCVTFLWENCGANRACVFWKIEFIDVTEYHFAVYVWIFKPFAGV